MEGEGGLGEHVITFHNGFNEFDNTGARMLDCCFYVTLQLFESYF